MDLGRKIGFSAAEWTQWITSSQIMRLWDSFVSPSFSCLLFSFWTVQFNINAAHFVRMSEMACFCYITRKTTYSVCKYNFESFWLWNVNSKNSYVSLAVFWLHLLMSFSGENYFSVSLAKIKVALNRWKSTRKSISIGYFILSFD